MSTNLIYEKCPVYETPSFMLRLVRLEDAEPLLACYSDKKAVSKLNADSCTSDFYYATVEEMEECIRFWLRGYQERWFVRFAILPKPCDAAVGTVEIFGGETGVLRIDIAANYDKEEYVEELIRLAVLRFIRDFSIGSLKIKTSNTPERIPILEKYGFAASAAFRPESEYYERPVIRAFDAGKGIAFCGLACCVCSENENCAGCKEHDCQSHKDCRHYNCCRTKELDGCWECGGFPCDSPMYTKLRVRTFAKFASQYGAENLVRALKQNEECGALYHYPGRLTGDYDLFQREEEIIQLLNRGLE